MITAAEAFSKRNSFIKILSDIDERINDILVNTDNKNEVSILFPRSMVPEKGKVLIKGNTFDNVISKLIEYGYSITVGNEDSFLGDPTLKRTLMLRHLIEFITAEDQVYDDRDELYVRVIPVTISWEDPSNPKVVDERTDNNKEEDWPMILYNITGDGDGKQNDDGSCVGVPGK